MRIYLLLSLAVLLWLNFASVVNCLKFLAFTALLAAACTRSLLRCHIALITSGPNLALVPKKVTGTVLDFQILAPCKA